jgi:hypothetical protein
MEHKRNAVRLEILKVARFGVEDVQLFPKRNQIQVGKFLPMGAELAVQVFPVRNEVFDQALHIHNKPPSLLVFERALSQSPFYYLLLSLVHSLGKTLVPA